MVIDDIGSDKRLILDMGWFGRETICLNRTDWTYLRIAMRLCLSSTAANIDGGRLAVGFSSGASFYGEKTPKPAHALMICNEGPFNVWTFSATPSRYSTTFAIPYVFKGTAVAATGAADMEDGTWYVGAEDDHRTLYFVDIAKGSPNYTCKCFRCANTACTDVSKAVFDIQSVTRIPSLGEHTYQAGTTVAVNEAANGYFTHLNLFWTKTTPVVKISDLRVIKW